MKKLLLYSAALILLSGCQESAPSVDPPKKITVTDMKTEPIDPIKALQIEGLIELHSFEHKYVEKWDNLPEQFPYTNDSLIKVYRLECQEECHQAPFRSRSTEGIVISKNDFIELADLLKNPDSYDNSRAACYEPGFGLVVYDAKGVPSEYLSICMNCNSARSYPGKLNIEYNNEILNGFSSETRDQLRAMFKKWGVDYYGYMSFWDDEAAHNEYLKKK